MTRIDELPLDLFGGDEAAGADDSIPTGELPSTAATASTPQLAVGDGIPLERQRIYDALIVCGMIAGIGLLFQILWFDILAPIINTGAGVLIYQMAPEYWRQRQRWRFESVLRRFNSDVERLRSTPMSSSSTQTHLVYDVVLVALCVFVLRLTILSAGFGWIMPGRVGWFMAIAGASVIYVKLVRPRRDDVHIWLDAHLQEHANRHA